MPYNRYSHSFKIAYNKSAVSLLKSGEYIVYKGDQQHRQMAEQPLRPMNTYKSHTYQNC